MKKTCFVLLGILSSISVLANNQPVVVRGNGPTLKGNTEVYLESDSIIVKPTVDVTSIIITVTDALGEVLSEQVLPAQSDTTVNVATPSPFEGYKLELRDDNGIVYSESCSMPYLCNKP